MLSIMILCKALKPFRGCYYKALYSTLSSDWLYVQATVALEAIIGGMNMNHQVSQRTILRSTQVEVLVYRTDPNLWQSLDGLPEVLGDKKHAEIQGSLDPTGCYQMSSAAECDIDVTSELYDGIIPRI